ncbi:hypothetical protein [Natronosalvus rutilus]|uniref:DUF8009 domain-containing protein n=1 Tax=Natronosalvus rutilus TaxID=2953753 RepID=A0A9E7NDZ0_9EURY|nr:hypothetical protein [Natronosalvus rutilus]UTF55143.1 hypothetical protein NGM29_07800 [Natronosalvus rutilus]
MPSDDRDRDPTIIRSLAVAAEDVVNAFVYTRENPGRAILRATPPFHGRMRARLHVYRVDDSPKTGAVHLEAAALLDAETVAAYPTLEDVEQRVGGEASAGTVREQRADALEAWAERARESIFESVAFETADGPHRVSVRTLG